MTAIPMLPITADPPTGALAPVPEGDAFSQIIAGLDVAVALSVPSVVTETDAPQIALAEAEAPAADPSAEAMAAAQQLLAVAAPQMLRAGRNTPDAAGEPSEAAEETEAEAPAPDCLASAVAPAAMSAPALPPTTAEPAPAAPHDAVALEMPKGKGEGPVPPGAPGVRKEAAPALPTEAGKPIRDASQALRQHPGLAALLREAISLPVPAARSARAGEASLLSIAAADAPAGPAPPIALFVQPLAVPDNAGEPLPLDPSADAGTMMIERQLDLAQDGAWLDQLAKDIARSAGEASPLRFRLNPENLGSLHVEITPDKGGAAIRLTADTEAARTIIADAQPRLVAEARAQGVRISEAHVDLSSQQQSADQRRQQEAFEEAPIRTARVLQEREESDGKPTQRGSDLYA
jgi:hypothetical protein